MKKVIAGCIDLNNKSPFPTTEGGEK
nr:MAG: hypothetical protein [Bacteriophage sp.]